MADAPAETPRSNWLDCCGFAHLFRSFRISITHTQLTLAFAGVLLTYVAGRALDGLWPAGSRPVVSVSGRVSELDSFVSSGGSVRTARQWIDSLGGDGETGPPRRGAFALMLDQARSTSNDVVSAVMRADLSGVVGGVQAAVLTVVWLFAMHPIYAVLFVLITLLIWAFFGGGCCRIAALRAARDDRIDIREALNFARGRLLQFMFGPLIPLVLLVGVGLFLFLGGLVGAIPAIGEVLVAILFFLAMAGGIAAAMLIIGGVAGFHLTFPTVAVEGSDAFDAFSRSFAYIYSRPWRTAFYLGVSIAYGAICLFFVKLLARIALWAVHLFVGISMNWGGAYLADDAAAAPGKLDALWHGPTLTTETTFWGSFDGVELAGLSWFAQFLIKCWVYGLVGLVAAFVVSFFFSASTVMYLLLRRAEDATDIEDVFLEEDLMPPAGSTGDTSAPKEGAGSGGADGGGGNGGSGGVSLPVVQ